MTLHDNQAISIGTISNPNKSTVGSILSLASLNSLQAILETPALASPEGCQCAGVPAGGSMRQ